LFIRARKDGWTAIVYHDSEFNKLFAPDTPLPSGLIEEALKKANA
jgi:hypothetical protein